MADVDNVRVQKLSPTGQPLAQMSVPPSGSSRSVRDVTVDKEGSIWVLDSVNRKVFKLSPEGQPLTTPDARDFGGRPSYPFDLGVDRGGNILVVYSIPEDGIGKLSPGGDLQAHWATNSRAVTRTAVSTWLPPGSGSSPRPVSFCGRSEAGMAGPHRQGGRRRKLDRRPAAPVMVGHVVPRDLADPAFRLAGVPRRIDAGADTQVDFLKAISPAIAT